MIDESDITYQFINCTILKDHKIVKDNLWVRNGKILNPEKVFYDEKVKSNKKIDCQNSLIAPGFIDIQINGGFGVDFSHDTGSVEAGLQKVAKGLLAHGVTSFCPTLVTSTPEVYAKVIPKVKKTAGGMDGASVLGLHLEGPFISPQKQGAHNPNAIRGLDKGIQTLDEVYGPLDNVQIITLAPELPRATEVISSLVRRGITVSLGHSTADLRQGEEGAKHGASLITHLFNAMLPFHHRDPGLVGLLTTDNTRPLFYGIIADGVHTHPAALRIAWRAHPKGVVLVTDAISALGLPEGTHHLGELSIQVSQGKAYIAGTQTLCGSIASMDYCVRYFRKASGCSVVEALEAASLHPAQAIGLSQVKGSLDYGADADFVLLSDDLHVDSTWIAGRCVYKAGS
ncbi:N-acetylglucosamine-6-phosphate deacetylase [Macrosteles quadrilineatus]|uniref:N-acetylglucosamine-6-phosphate deacetylase n=1 Tax=Macrosteles quadrilineatus TaxID=74068 RepID=UPI0023E2E87A|nr:N-acetylglucosamine-6-phosphate deacetylase [Macrosteles quadrilineatus]XP_054263625.1 N-acetylglucosamine-6-phosphate deacetylase [Macrosteles quadrilineatus]